MVSEFKADASARARILDAAEDLFATRGFDATPTASIAQTAAVGKGLLFYYFPTKEDLLSALLRERMPHPEQLNLEGVVRPGDVSGSLVRLARKLDIEGHDTAAMLSIAMHEAPTHPEVAASLHAMRDDLYQVASDVLGRASTRRLTPALRRDAAQLFVAVVLDTTRADETTTPDLRRAAGFIAAGLGDVH